MPRDFGRGRSGVPFHESDHAVADRLDSVAVQFGQFALLSSAAGRTPAASVRNHGRPGRGTRTDGGSFHFAKPGATNGIRAPADDSPQP